MNSTLMYLQADMHRAINSGNSRIEVSILDLKELIAAVMSAEGREEFERVGQGFAFMNPEKLKDFRSGKRMYGTVRLKKNEEFSEKVYCLPDPKPAVDMVSKCKQDCA